jgi:hypothetical protein
VHAVEGSEYSGVVVAVECFVSEFPVSFELVELLA